MSHWRVYNHLVWATKNRQPLIDTAVEAVLYGYIIGKADSLRVITHAIGGIEDHIHLVVSIPPRLSIAEVVRKLKGSSGHHLNHTLRSLEGSFAWQRGYGVYSFGETQLGRAVGYARNQKRHHEEGTTIAALEMTSDEDDGPSPWTD